MLRKVIDVVPDSRLRFFVVYNRLFCPTKVVSKQAYALAKEVVEQLRAKKVPFYSIDIAMTTSGTLYVIKLDDGQVSASVGWDLEHFAKTIGKLAIWF